MKKIIFYYNLNLLPFFQEKELGFGLTEADSFIIKTDNMGGFIYETTIHGSVATYIRKLNSLIEERYGKGVKNVSNDNIGKYNSIVYMPEILVEHKNNK